MADELTPLPLASTTSGPSVSTAAPVAEPPVSVAAPTSAPSGVEVDDRDVVSAWIDDHSKEFEQAPNADASAQVPTPEAPASTTAPATAPSGESAPPPVATTAPTTEKPTPATTVAEVPTTAPTTAAPSKPSFAPDEKFSLAEGSEWTRAQIVQALQERVASTQEREQFRTLFGMEAKQAKEVWEPILRRLATEPDTATFLDSYLQDPARADYLNRCAAFYEEQSGAPAAATAPRSPAAQATQRDPETQRKIAELEQWKSQQEQREAVSRVNREWASVTSRYPFLATNDAARKGLVLLAQQLAAQDPSKGILDAVEMNAAMYEAMNAAAGARQTTQDVPPPAAVPALVSGQGASPNGSRPARSGRPQKFDNLDEAVDDWVKNPPPEFR